MRRPCMKPKFLPAHGCDTRTQHELFSFFLPRRSQWNCTLTRPYLSVNSSSPDGPTTTAVCGTWTNGFGVARGGRYCCVDGIAANVHRYVPALPFDSYPSTTA